MLRNISQLKQMVPNLYLHNAINQKRKFITIVNQAEVAYRQFLGMNRVRLEPGIRINLPILHQITRVDLREQSEYMDNLMCHTGDNVPIIVSGTLFFKVNDAEKACFEIYNYNASVRSVGMSVARATIGKFSYDQLISQRNQINNELIKTIGDSIKKWGVECTKFEIGQFAPKDSSVASFLQKQVEAERSRRENELNTLARIRTAEGERDKEKLVADGLLYATRAKADSEAYSLETIAKATAESLNLQINSVRQTLPKLSDTEIVTYLIEKQRLEHLRSIASSPNNNTYFFDPKGIYPTPMLLPSHMQSSVPTKTNSENTTG